MWSDLIPFFARRKAQQEIDLRKWQPALNVSLDRKVYRPGDSVIATIEIRNAPSSSGLAAEAILVEDLLAQLRGGEKLDHQWLVPKAQSQNPKEKRGERVFFESRGPVACNCYLGADSAKEYVIRTTLPKLLPPSYRGTSVRYFYYLTVNVQWSFITGERTQASSLAVPLQKRIMFTVWNLPNHNGLSADDLQVKESYSLGGIVPMSLVESEMYWKDNDDYGEWSRACGILPAIEDDVSSQGTESVAHSPIRGSPLRLTGLEHSIERLVLPSPASTPRKEINRASSKKATSLTASSSDTCISREQGSRFQKQNSLNRSSSENGTLWNGCIEDGYVSDQEESHPKPGPALGGYLRGRAYNIRIDDHILAQVSPRNPESVYYFGDTVSGVISFPGATGFRKCLEVSATLEVREIVNPSYLHPSRKNSQVIAKVQAEYLEVVADMSQTQFIFSIPLDGPSSFSTPHMTVQWVIRFEFMSTPTPDTVDWRKQDHPLQIKERDRGEWLMPITVHAPLPRPHGGARRERLVSSLRDFWIQSPRASDWTVETPRGSPVVGPSNGHL